MAGRGCGSCGARGWAPLAESSRRELQRQRCVLALEPVFRFCIGVFRGERPNQAGAGKCSRVPGGYSLYLSRSPSILPICHSVRCRVLIRIEFFFKRIELSHALADAAFGMSGFVLDRASGFV